ncbi:hypothetical protein B0J11DRAFT_607523 [Dendryphion nanum]|uniref:Uncharacterized protein n=1 Tax=Dendryphion nanum TaxID=256645 RepID=A0A9P9DPK1_9PLEO|nr:hypothetical protein B0J11DRAFT_607523 [Dendryphion nanum]
MGDLNVAATLDAPRTPEHGNNQLLTPPATARTPKRFQFFDDEEDVGGRVPRRIRYTHELKDLESSDGPVTLSNVEEGYITTLEDSQPTTPTSSSVSELLATTSQASDPPVTEQDDLAGIVHTNNTSEVTGPFAFMKLPLTIRNNVYGYLVTTPSLVCVRQNRTTELNEKGVYVYAENRALLSGISFVLTKKMVDGFKSRFGRAPFVNVSILTTNQKISQEAKAVMYGENVFQLSNLTKETSPVVDYKVPLFPRGYPKMIRHIVISAKSLYGFRELLNGGHRDLKNYYRGVESLSIIIELDDVHSGFAKKAARKAGEDFLQYVKRMHRVLQLGIFDCTGISRSIPDWVHLYALFPGDNYMDNLNNTVVKTPGNDFDIQDHDVVKENIRAVIILAFDMFKK